MVLSFVKEVSPPDAPARQPGRVTHEAGGAGGKIRSKFARVEMILSVHSAIFGK
jgi:hypothetical protein